MSKNIVYTNVVIPYMYIVDILVSFVKHISWDDNKVAWDNIQTRAMFNIIRHAVSIIGKAS